MQRGGQMLSSAECVRGYKHGRRSAGERSVCVACEWGRVCLYETKCVCIQSVQDSLSICMRSGDVHVQ